MKRIDISTPTYPNTFTLVDDEDFDWLNQWKWYAHKDRHIFYAVRKNPKVNGKRQLIRMHRIIMKPNINQEIDHRNGNGLDNRRSVNLRFCTHAQNLYNQRPQRNRTSKYKGVCFGQERKKWQAAIRYKGKLCNLGRFSNEIDAAKAYDHKALELFGEFAQTNYTPVGELFFEVRK